MSSSISVRSQYKARLARSFTLHDGHGVRDINPERVEAKKIVQPRLFECLLNAGTQMRDEYTDAPTLHGKKDERAVQE